MSEYVPTMSEIRDGFVWLSGGENPGAREAAGEDFDTAIAAHDREVEVAALREAARAVTRDKSITGLARATIHTWVYNYADRIESEARPMSALTKCPYLIAKGMHLYVGYRVAATGKTGECCHGCGVER